MEIKPVHLPKVSQATAGSKSRDNRDAGSQPNSDAEASVKGSAPKYPSISVPRTLFPQWKRHPGKWAH